jgi:hypothetical protein
MNGVKNVVRIALRRGKKISQSVLRIIPQECLSARGKLPPDVKRRARSDEAN